MKYFIALIILSILSCGQDKNTAIVVEKNISDSILLAKHFSCETEYNALSLLYKGEPLQIIGEVTDTMVSRGLWFHADPNGEFQDLRHGIISDHMCIDDDLQISLSDNSSLNGIIYFSSEFKTKEIFSFAGNWTFNCEVNDATIQQISEKITSELFPALQGHIKIEDKWSFTIEQDNIIEEFEIQSPAGNKSSFWHLNYDVILK